MNKFYKVKKHNYIFGEYKENVTIKFYCLILNDEVYYIKTSPDNKTLSLFNENREFIFKDGICINRIDCSNKSRNPNFSVFRYYTQGIVPMEMNIDINDNLNSNRLHSAKTITSRTIVLKTINTQNTTYIYDNVGNCTMEIFNNDGNIEYFYDEDNKITVQITSDIQNKIDMIFYKYHEVDENEIVDLLDQYNIRDMKSLIPFMNEKELNNYQSKVNIDNII